MNFLKKIFGKYEKNTKLPLIQEPLVRSESEVQAYTNWVESHKRSDLQAFLRQQFELFLSEQPYQSCKFIQNAHTGGMIFYPTGPYTTQDCQHFLDYLRDAILPLNYRKYMSDVKQYNRKDFVEKIERHYLKPRYVIDPETQKANQLYGNIHLELTYKNDIASHLKLLCHNYHDQKFKTSLSFKSLIFKIL